MRKTTFYQIVAVIIILIALCGVFLYLFSTVNDSDNSSVADDNGGIKTTIIGSNANGTVYRTICGNQDSKDTAVLILGVHNLENGTHNAVYKTVLNLSKERKLNKKFVVYSIKIDYNNPDLDTVDYSTNRHMGELLAYDYVVNDVKNYNPYVVVDVHEMEDYWVPDRYLQIMSVDNQDAFKYLPILENDTGISEYNFTEGTSPQWVTVPISNQGFPTILFEYAQAESQANKLNVAKKLVLSVDHLKN